MKNCKNIKNFESNCFGINSQCTAGTIDNSTRFWFRVPWIGLSSITWKVQILDKILSLRTSLHTAEPCYIREAQTQRHKNSCTVRNNGCQGINTFHLLFADFYHFYYFQRCKYIDKISKRYQTKHFLALHAKCVIAAFVSFQRSSLWHVLILVVISWSPHCGTRPLARPFARSLAPLTRWACPACSRPPLRLLVRFLAHFAHSLTRGIVNNRMAICSVFFFHFRP